MKSNPIIKSLFLLAILITHQSSAATARNILKVTGCLGDGVICTDVTTMEAYARSKVLQHTESKSGQGRYDYIFQSDAIDKVYLFQYDYNILHI